MLFRESGQWTEFSFKERFVVTVKTQTNNQTKETSISILTFSKVNKHKQIEIII